MKEKISCEVTALCSAGGSCVGFFVLFFNLARLQIILGFEYGEDFFTALCLMVAAPCTLLELPVRFFRRDQDKCESLMQANIHIALDLNRGHDQIGKKKSNRKKPF